jgi:molybdopterin/thiamine biosynthesis adenylyltransferase
VDCCDNFNTRFAINSSCVRHQIPLISGAAIRFTGQVTVFLPAQLDSPCYHCLYHNDDEQAETCSETGIISPLAGIIGSIQAVETLKILLNSGQSLCGKLLIFDALTLQWKKMTFKKDVHCPVCSKQLT